MYSVFDPRQRLRFMLILVMLLFQSLVEVLGLGLILPLLYVAQDTGRVLTNPYLNFVYELFHFKSGEQFTVFLALTLVFAFVFKGFFSVWLINIQTKFSHTVSSALIERQTRIGFGMDFLTFKKNNSNKMVQDLVTIPMEFSTGIVQPILIILAEVLVTAVIAIGVALFEFKVFLGLILVLLPPIYLFYRVSRKRITRLGAEKNDLRSEAYKHIFGAVHGIESVKITSSEVYFKHLILKSFERLFVIMRKLVVLENVPIRVIEFTAILAVCLIVVFSMFANLSSRPILPLLVVFATAAYRLLPSLNRIVSASVRLRGSGYVIERIKEFSSTESPMPIEKFDEELRFERSLTLSGLYFKYPGKDVDVLNGLSLKIKKGEFLGIIGRSGEGKSTFLKVFLKMFEPDSGTLSCDDIVVSRQLTRAWQSKIGYVQQNVFLLDGSVEENVAFGERNIDSTRVTECLKAASLDDFVSELPEGQKSKVGEFGNAISGGQMQRLAIARALYRDVEVLVLDEATSALDSDTEHEIMQTLDSLKAKGITILVVAHRLSSLYACDRIIEISGGVVSREVSYQTLVGRE